MAFGFLAKGDAGNVQIDEKYANLMFASKATVTSDSSRKYRITVTNAVSPIVLLRSTSGNVAWAGTVNPSVGTFYLEIRTQSASQSFDYWVFDRPNNVSLPSFGLLVKNSSGQVVYRSDKKPLKVVQIISLNYSNYPSITVPSGKTYAVVSSQPYASYNDPFGSVTVEGSKVTSATSIKLDPVILTDYNDLIVSYQPPTKYFMVVDLTNY